MDLLIVMMVIGIPAILLAFLMYMTWWENNDGPN
jgi:hypothetical protein